MEGHPRLGAVQFGGNGPVETETSLSDGPMHSLLSDIAHLVTEASATNG